MFLAGPKSKNPPAGKPVPDFHSFAPGIIIVLDSLTNYNPFTGKNLRQKMPEARSCVSYFAWI